MEILKLPSTFEFYKGGFIGFSFSSKSTSQSYSLRLLGLSSLASPLSSLLAISTHDVETPHFRQCMQSFPCMELAFYHLLSVHVTLVHTIEPAFYCSLSIHMTLVHSYHGHRILSFTIRIRNARTYHTHRVLSFTVRTLVTSLF